MPNQDYQRAVLRAVAVSTARGKRPGRSVVLNAASAALNISDRTGLTTALDQLVAANMVADRRGRLLITESGKEADDGLSPDAEKRLADHLMVSFKDVPEGLDQEQTETLFMVAVAEHHHRMIGVASIAQAFNESIAQAQQRVDALVDGGYLEPDAFDHRFGVPVTVYSLTRAGKFELRRGDLRMDSIRYPEAQSERARELIEVMAGVLSDE